MAGSPSCHAQSRHQHVTLSRRGTDRARSWGSFALFSPGAAEVSRCGACGAQAPSDGQVCEKGHESRRASLGAHESSGGDGGDDAQRRVMLPPCQNPRHARVSPHGAGADRTPRLPWATASCPARLAADPDLPAAVGGGLVRDLPDAVDPANRLPAGFGLASDRGASLSGLAAVWLERGASADDLK
jgi:hypothetical protein